MGRRNNKFYADSHRVRYITDADAETMIEWLNLTTGVVSTGSATVADEAGVYILSEANHCGTASDTIEIEFEYAPAAFNLGDDAVICPGDTVILHAPQTADVILWETPGGASVESQYLATLPGIVSLTLSNDCGMVSDDVLIEFDPNEPRVSLDPMSLCDGETVVLDATQPFDAMYVWNTGSTSSSIRISTPGLYAVSIITECYYTEEQIQVALSADCDPQVFIPNVFSPNSDGVNDVWEIVFDPAFNAISIECSVFDRWGNTAFNTHTPPIVWDGTFNDQVVMPGVYVYVLTVQSESGIDLISGSVTVVR